MTQVIELLFIVSAFEHLCVCAIGWFLYTIYITLHAFKLMEKIQVEKITFLCCMFLNNNLSRACVSFIIYIDSYNCMKENKEYYMMINLIMLVLYL